MENNQGVKKLVALHFAGYTSVENSSSGRIIKSHGLGCKIQNVFSELELLVLTGFLVTCFVVFLFSWTLTGWRVCVFLVLFSAILVFLIGVLLVTLLLFWIDVFWLRLFIELFLFNQTNTQNFQTKHS